jgi:hypothetical protein
MAPTGVTIPTRMASLIPPHSTDRISNALTRGHRLRKAQVGDDKARPNKKTPPDNGLPFKSTSPGYLFSIHSQYLLLKSFQSNDLFPALELTDQFFDINHAHGLPADLVGNLIGIERHTDQEMDFIC